MWLTTPNPRVGCVIVGPDGQRLGQGHTQAAGQAHAEVMALRDASARGHTTQGATAYVTLEPCSHHGRTPPCCDALIQAGLRRVVVAVTDPNPLVQGQGLARLRAAGIQVSVGLLAAEATELNLGFFKRMQTGLPWVRLKVAASVDGVTALRNGQSQWITSPEARQDGHAWRARACAVLTGVGTVLEDNPRLDVREVVTPRQPPLVVVDSRLQTPPNARLFEPQREVWLAHALSELPPGWAGPRSGVSTLALPNPSGKVDLPALFHALGERQLNEVHVEAGHKLNASLLREGCVDEILLYVAPKLLGQGQGLTQLGPFERLDQGLSWRFVETSPVGPDLRLRLRPA
jgi:diaminohydroxyphosphoribosylaminopyrimidine deaminase/5-amino-6-(5-phosphoribosylamino)uracil reductase